MLRQENRRGTGDGREVARLENCVVGVSGVPFVCVQWAGIRSLEPVPTGVGMVFWYLRPWRPIRPCWRWRDSPPSCPHVIITPDSNVCSDWVRDGCLVENRPRSEAPATVQAQIMIVN